MLYLAAANAYRGSPFDRDDDFYTADPHQVIASFLSCIGDQPLRFNSFVSVSLSQWEHGTRFSIDGGKFEQLRNKSGSWADNNADKKGRGV